MECRSRPIHRPMADWTSCLRQIPLPSVQAPETVNFTKIGYLNGLQGVGYLCAILTKFSGLWAVSN